MSRSPDVLVVGAGPTGLVLALWLTRLGITVRIVDQTAEPGTTSRALAVQARTLEFYRQLGLDRDLLDRGRQVSAAHLWVAGRRVADLTLGDMGRGISPYPYAFIFPQDEHERLLIERLRDAGVTVERETTLLDFVERDAGVTGRLQDGSGKIEKCEAAYIAGCDGAHSRVRQLLSIDFAGGTYEHLFYVADVEAAGEVMDGDIHVGLDRSEFLVAFPLTAPSHARLIGTVRDESSTEQHDNLAWEDVGRRVLEWMRVDVRRVNWFSTYRVHHRVAAGFRRNRAFLLGDAAHVHSPVGGQGMNTGIGDAVNLAWKLAAVIGHHAAPALLDTYEPERLAFARRLVDTTDRAFTGVTSSSALARAVRLHAVPLALPPLLRLPQVRRFMFRTISQTAIEYRDSAASDGRAGGLHGGDRLPWVPADSGADNFAVLTALDWQVHIYGEARPDAPAFCAPRRLPLHVFPWLPAAARAGIQRHALYLVRPDGYVALASAEASVEALETYLRRWEIRTRGADTPLQP
ncbi:MAG TPA: FAD-dependent monooxygenase [Vicinamibacterales bacterium]|jgi:2-polyprenyl-6-methoxyphenol hydroxylase-like FAD-dependent oxidoreductase